jgi:hypothetical protein
MDPLDPSDAVVRRAGAVPERPSQGCPECFGRLLYNGFGYSCIACAYTCPLLGYPAFSGRGRSRVEPRCPPGAPDQM